MVLPNVMKKRIVNYLKEGKRFDGRSPLQYRDLTIETGVSKKAEGSARVRLGKTEVLAGIKVALVEPYPDSPDEGTLMVTAEFSPMASDRFERGPPSIEAIELARVIDRGIRESECIDLKKLCLKKGEQVWSIFVDIYPINDNGNLMDAASLAAMAALKSAVLPKVTKEGKVDFGNFTKNKIPVKDEFPLNMTFHKIGDHFLLDPTTDEEDASEARLSIAISQLKKGELINSLQKGGDAPISIKELDFIFTNALKESKKMFTNFKKALK